MSPDPILKFYFALLGYVHDIFGGPWHSTCLEVRDNSVRSVLSFYRYVGFRDQTRVIRLVWQAFLPEKSLSSPSTLSYETESLTEPESVSLTRMVVNSTLRSVCLYLPNYSDRHTLSSQLLCGFRDMNSGLCSKYFTHGPSPRPLHFYFKIKMCEQTREIQVNYTNYLTL